MPENGAARVWTAAGVCSGIALALGGAVGSSYVRDQDRVEERMKILESRGYIDAASAGRIEQEIRELRGIGASNKANIEKMLEGQDTMLQREIVLRLEPERVRLEDLERRVQKLEETP